MGSKFHCAAQVGHAFLHILNAGVTERPVCTAMHSSHSPLGGGGALQNSQLSGPMKGLIPEFVGQIIKSKLPNTFSIFKNNQNVYPGCEQFVPS